MVYLDTNALIRFFTKDDLAKAEKVKNLLEKESEIIINDVVFPELDYVLRKVYNRKRSEVAAAFKFLLSYRTISCSKMIHGATHIYETSNLDMADCIIVTESMKGKLASFDEKLIKIEGVKSYW